MVQNFEVREKSDKTLKPWGIRGLKPNAHKPHYLYIFSNFSAL